MALTGGQRVQGKKKLKLLEQKQTEMEKEITVKSKMVCLICNWTDRDCSINIVVSVGRPSVARAGIQTVVI